MPLFGTLNSMPLPDLMQWLGTTRKTGTLLVERRKVSKSIVFNAGTIVGCSSDDPPERLGHFLLARGKITEEQLRDGLALQAETGKYLGVILVEFGAFAPEELEAHLEDKAEETIYSLFDWTDGVFRFDDELTEDANIFPVQLRVEDVLLRGLQRFDEMKRIREVFEDPGIVLRARRGAVDAGAIKDPMARTLFESIDGERTFAELLLHVHGSEFVVKRQLFEFLEDGWIEVAEVKPPVVPTFADPSSAMDLGRASTEAAVASHAPVDGLDRPMPLAADARRASTAAAVDDPRSLPLSDAAAPIVSLPLSALEPDADPGIDGTGAFGTDKPILDWQPQPTPADPQDAAPSSAPAAAGAAAPETAEAAAAVASIRHGLEELIAPGGQLESVDASDVHNLSRQLEHVRRLMSAGETETALDVLDQIYQQFPGDESLRRLTTEAEGAFIEKAYRHFLPPNKIPVLTRPMVELEKEHISPTEFFMLSRVDESWNVRAIIQIAPMREVDALRTLKKLRENGIIELKDPAA